MSFYTSWCTHHWYTMDVCFLFSFQICLNFFHGECRCSRLNWQQKAKATLMSYTWTQWRISMWRRSHRAIYSWLRSVNLSIFLFPSSPHYMHTRGMDTTVLGSSNQQRWLCSLCKYGLWHCIRENYWLNAIFVFSRTKWSQLQNWPEQSFLGLQERALFI